MRKGHGWADRRNGRGAVSNGQNQGIQLPIARAYAATEAADPMVRKAAVLFDADIDLVYHYYLQHHATDDIRDSNLDAEPDGRHRELGHGLDLVLGYHGIEDLSAKLVVGAFVPGRAFSSDADNAYFASFELRG